MSSESDSLRATTLLEGKRKKQVSSINTQFFRTYKLCYGLQKRMIYVTPVNITQQIENIVILSTDITTVQAQSCFHDNIAKL